MMDTALGLGFLGIVIGFVWHINNKANNRVVKELTTKNGEIIERESQEGVRGQCLTC